MTSDGTNTYSWDACDRLVQITYPGSGNNSQLSYDGLGRCVQITENVAGTPTTLSQLGANTIGAQCDCLLPLTEYPEFGKTFAEGQSKLVACSPIPTKFVVNFD